MHGKCGEAWLIRKRTCRAARQPRVSQEACICARGANLRNWGAHAHRCGVSVTSILVHSLFLLLLLKLLDQPLLAFNPVLPISNHLQACTVAPGCDVLMERFQLQAQVVGQGHRCSFICALPKWLAAAVHCLPDVISKCEQGCWNVSA